METKILADICQYRRETISVEHCNIETFISTENMLPNKAGISPASKCPTSGNVSKYYPGDVLVSNIRPYFKKIYLADTTGTCSNDVLVFHPKHDVCTSEFLYCVLSTDEFFSYATTTAKGTKMPRGDRSAIMNYQINWVPIHDQSEIAETILNIYRKIKLNEKINDNLEAQALALFNDFYSKSNQEVLYTDQIKILGGGTPKTGEPSFWDGAIPFFTPKDAKFSYTICTEKKLTTEGLSHCNSQLYPKNTVFVTARGTVGKISLAGVPMAMNQSCYALIGKGVPQLLVYFYTQKIIRNLKKKANGAVFDAITTRDFESETVMKFSDDLLNKFSASVEPMYNLILNNHLENQQLTSLRNSLLNQLMHNDTERLES